MLVEKAESPAPAPVAHHRATFFRQSGWLMFANIAGGVLMWAVHFLSKKIPESEYGNFGAYLAVLILIPNIPLQTVLAQQTAKALAHNKEHALSGVIRLFWWGTSAVWFVAALVVLMLQRSILERFQIADPTGLWLTLLIALLSLWLPVFWGVLQGRQNFLWLGWSTMTSAIGRIAVAAFAVLALHAWANGIMAGVLFGIAAALALAAWQTRSVWLTRPEPFDWRGLLAQVMPMMLAFAGFQILFTVDTLFVKAYFTGKEAGFYVSAGTLSRALMWLVLPLAAVMFPRLVHSAARSEMSNLMGMVFAGTGVLAVLGALSLSVLGPWIVRLVFKQSYVAVASSVLPWYAFAMVPLALANVLLNNLLARPASKLVLALCVFGLALGYMFALSRFHGSLTMVLQTMGVFNLLLLAVCAWFSWTGNVQSPESKDQS